jgi:hypothetical protein
MASTCGKEGKKTSGEVGFGTGPKGGEILVDHAECGIHRSWNRPPA